MNCIWITTDSFRQDHVHCYRPEGTIDDTGQSIQVQTPSMDRLQGGVQSQGPESCRKSLLRSPNAGQADPCNLYCKGHGLLYVATRSAGITSP